MPKTIPIALAAHQALPATTLCFLQKVGPLPDSSYICLTSLDRDVEYDDGTGSGLLTYYASSGMEPSQLSASNDLSVDNGETKTLTPIFPAQGITVEAVDNGDLDGAQFITYKVNYLDLSMGHEIMAAGVIGEVRITPGGMVTFENRSWSQLLKQNSVVELDSFSCRARFGSQPIGTGGGAYEQRFPCTYDLTAEWVAGTVSGLGEETVRVFASAELVQADDYFAPGLVRWVTGDNAGLDNEISGYAGPIVDPATDAVVTLQFTTRNPIQVGDTFEIRRDCTKAWAGHNSCETFNNRPKFRGEPFIPVSDVTGLSIPGASSGGLRAGAA
ncbi:baseplate hub domain-containing protein [Lysobacter sp. F6437]|uniref:baseplate hub domain-containing protein n=1 Tax=Lysobacter sp. F6437 TaxID=3459296 RepID=UPI00403D8020